MTVCTLTHTYPRFVHDINAPFVEQLMERIASKGVNISVLTAYDPAWDRAPGDHIVDLRTYRYIWPERLHILGYSRTIEGNVRFRKRVLLLSPFLFFAGFFAFLRLVREKKPDVLHAHWILPNGFLAALVSKATGVPLIIQLHGSDVFTAEKNPVFRHMALYAASRASVIVSPSPDLSSRLAAMGADISRVRIVPNTVDAGFADHVTPAVVEELRRRIGVPDGARVVLAMGRMVHVKGFSYLVEAFARIADDHPDTVLVLAGGGVLYDDIKRLTAALDVEKRVIMPGPADRSVVPVYFRMAEMFVVPSIRHESGAVDGLPVVVPEAMAAGLPVVASEVGGIPVLVRNGRTGILVPERNSIELAGAIDRLLSDRDTARTFGERARRIIESRVNYDAVAEYFAKLYTLAAQNVPAGEIPSFNFDEESES